MLYPVAAASHRWLGTGSQPSGCTGCRQTPTRAAGRQSTSSQPSGDSCSNRLIVQEVTCTAPWHKPPAGRTRSMRVLAAVAVHPGQAGQQHLLGVLRLYTPGTRRRQQAVGQSPPVFENTKPGCRSHRLCRLRLVPLLPPAGAGACRCSRRQHRYHARRRRQWCPQPQLCAVEHWLRLPHRLRGLRALWHFQHRRSNTMRECASRARSGVAPADVWQQCSYRKVVPLAAAAAAARPPLPALQPGADVQRPPAAHRAGRQTAACRA